MEAVEQWHAACKVNECIDIPTHCLIDMVIKKIKVRAEARDEA